MRASDTRVNARVPPELVARLRGEAQRREIPVSQLVREALEAAVTVPRPLLARTDGTVDLASWIATNGGVPRALAASKIRQGRVLVDGVVCRDLVVPPPSLVVVDGVSVRARTV